MTRKSLIFLAVTLVGGCAAPLAIQQTGRVVPQGDIRLGAGVGIGVSTSALDVVDAAGDAARDLDAAMETCEQDGGEAIRCVEAMRYEPLVRSGLVGLLLTPIVPFWTVRGRYGITDGVDIGGRYTGATMRLDANVQLYGPTDGSPGASATLGIGWNHHFVYVPSILEKLHLDAFSRDDIDVPLIFSWQFGRFVKLATGVRYMASHWAIDLRPDVPVWVRAATGAAGADIDEQADELERAILDELPETDEDGWFHHFGGLVSIWGGYKWVWVGAELTMTWYDFEATLVGTHQDLSGLVVFPSLAMYAQF